jgi:hypothetical protein
MYSWMSCSDIAGVWKKRIEEKNNIFSKQRKAETEQKEGLKLFLNLRRWMLS